MTKSAPAMLFLATLLPVTGLAQTSPFLPDDLRRTLVNEISGDRSFEHVRQLTHFHRTGPGRDFWAATEYIRKSAKDAGLEDVRLIRQKWTGHPWTCESGEAWLLGPEPVKVADFGEVAVSIADHSRTTHVSVELVDVGTGNSASDYEGVEVEGRVVLASGSPSSVMQEAVWKRGALGVVSHASNSLQPFDAPDQVAWGRIPYEAKGVEGVDDGTRGSFTVMVSPRRGRWIQERLAAAGGPLEIKIDIEARHSARSEQGMVEGWIRGSKIHDQQIVLVSHIQEEMTSANDDGSGCANMLEIGRALARLIRDGKVPRPRRDIRFWWVNELASERQYFRDHPETPGRMLVAINQDMVGARQSWGGRVQYASRLPWSLPHALDDVMESILEAIR
ncbi:MAG: M28 family peptidase, partial [Thermoanaerobaculia bacterium]